MNEKKHIALFGSTGSIGVQTLEVIDSLPEHFSVEILTAQKNADLLIAQSRKFLPNAVVIGDDSRYGQVRESLSDLPVKVFCGEQALLEVADWDTYDLALGAIVGFAGLKPTLKVLEKGKPLALANKETLVVAGDIVMETSRRTGATIIPVDSEHSAIFQCLQGERRSSLEKVILTASGGPFLGKKTNFLINVKKDHALQHPNWNMGPKVSIDSATLMNKGLEMIEASWLFGLRPDQIEVVIHSQSVIHSMIQMTDGSIKAQLGLPDMRLPIQYALSYPGRLVNNLPRFRFKDYPNLSFEPPDMKTFRNLAIAMDVLVKGGNAPCVMNASNEEVVQAFLKNRVGFLEMTEIIEKVLARIPYIPKPTLEQYMESDLAARKATQILLSKIN